MYGPFIYTVQTYVRGGLVLSTEWVAAKSVGIKGVWARGREGGRRMEEACARRYNRYFSYQFLFAIHSDDSPSVRPSVRPCSQYSADYRFPTRQCQPARRCCSCTVMQARKRMASRFCRSLFFYDATKIVNETLGDQRDSAS